MWDLSSLIRDQTHIPCIVRQILYHRTTREVPCGNVIECKFVCLMHSEAKQTKRSEFGAVKDLLQGQARRMGDSCSKTPKLPDGFQGEVFIGKIWGEGYRVCDFLLIGWW